MPSVPVREASSRPAVTERPSANRSRCAMSEETWRFRVTRGVVTVRDDTIGIRSTPGYFLAGQRSRWWYGDRWERGKIVFGAGGLLSSVLGAIYHFAQVGLAGVGLQSAPHVFAVVLFAYVFWSNHLGETTVSQSAIDTITLDESEGVLVITHEVRRGHLASLGALGSETTETKLSLPTDDDVREAKEIFRLRGIDVEEPRSESTETTYRVVTRGGVCFCERCRSQVSPSDGVCPACGYAIRVRGGGDPVSEDAKEIGFES